MLVSTAYAGGLSAWAEVEVNDVKMENGRVIIVGTGAYTHRVISHSKDVKDSVYGENAQVVKAKAKKVAFVIPTSDIDKRANKWWPRAWDTGNKVRVGDFIRIQYQGSDSLYDHFRLKEVRGAGVIKIKSSKKAKQPAVE